jgi:hypothetical protein
LNWHICTHMKNTHTHTHTHAHTICYSFCTFMHWTTKYYCCMKLSAQNNHKINLFYCTSLCSFLIKIDNIYFATLCFLISNLEGLPGLFTDKYCGHNKLWFPCLSVCFSLSHNWPWEQFPNTVEPRSIVFQGDGENKRWMRENDQSRKLLFLTRKVVHCLLLLGRILPQLKMWLFET